MFDVNMERGVMSLWVAERVVQKKPPSGRGRLRPPPVADEGSKKEWQASQNASKTLFAMRDALTPTGKGDRVSGGGRVRNKGSAFVLGE